MKLLHIGICINPEPNIDGFQKGLIQALGKENYLDIRADHPYLNTEAIRLFDAFKPDVVFMQIQEGGKINAQTCDYFKSHGARVINWTGDARQDTPAWMIELAPFVTCTAFSNMKDVKQMRALGFSSEYLEIGINPEIYKPTGDSYDVPEIVFMANNYGVGHFPLSELRIEIVNTLQKEFGDGFGVYGNGWPNGKGNINHSQIEEAKHYRGAKIAINCSHFNYDRYNSDRLLRILGTGTFCLSVEHEGMYQDYENGKHLVTVQNIEEMIEGCHFYLKNEEQRKRIAEAGCLLVHSRNTFAHQAKNILEL